MSQKQQQVFVAFSKESHQKFVVGFCNEICQPRGKSYRRKDRLYFSSIPPRIPIVLQQASIPQVSFGGGSSSLFWKLHRLRKKKRRGWTHINLGFILYWSSLECNWAIQKGMRKKWSTRVTLFFQINLRYFWCQKSKVAQLPRYYPSPPNLIPFSRLVWSFSWKFLVTLHKRAL